MRDDNDLLPAASDILKHQDYLNAKRLRAWRLRWRLQFGVWPDSADVYLWPYQGRMIEPRRPAHSNTNILKFPRHRRQYGRGTLPAGPYSAA